MSKSALCLLGLPIGVVSDPSGDRTDREVSCRLLLSLYVLDLISWGAGRTMVYEILWFGDASGVSVVRLSLILTTVEVAVEFLGSYCAPRFYQRFGERSRQEKVHQFTTRGLASFALFVYTVSNAVGAIVYPAVGAAVHLGGHKSRTWLVILICVWAFQYPFLNQVADQAVEMALPHWLATFRGVTIRLPGPRLCCGNLTTRVTSDSLALALNFMKFMLAVVLALAYVAARGQTSLRWAMVLSLCVFNAVCGTVLYRDKRLLRGVKDKKVEGEDAGVHGETTRWPCSLAGFEHSLIWFAVLAFGVPDQATNAILSLLTLRLNTLAFLAAVVVSAAIICVYFVRAIKKEAAAIESAMSDQRVAATAMHGAAEDAAESDGGGSICGVNVTEYGWWGLLVWISAAFMGAAALILLLGKHPSTFFVAIPFMLPVAVVAQMLKARFESYMFVHPEDSSSDINYWRNVFMVGVNGPVLLVNWFALDMVSGEQNQLAVVVAVTVCLFALIGIYYGGFDYCLPESMSLSFNVPRVRAEYLARKDKRRSSAETHVDAKRLPREPRDSKDNFRIPGTRGSPEVKSNRASKSTEAGGAMTSPSTAGVELCAVGCEQTTDA